jgi:hypothetical protein
VVAQDLELAVEIRMGLAVVDEDAVGDVELPHDSWTAS